MTRLVVGLVLSATIGCAYYNGLYNANQLAKAAQTAEDQGRRAEARSLWLQAAIKAESVVVRFPDSKYHDDALLMQGTALARLGSCSDAVAPLARAVEQSPDATLRIEAGLLLGGCHIGLGDGAAARRVLTGVLAIADSSYWGEAFWLRGRAALVEGRAEQALGDLRQSGHPDAQFDRGLALAMLGRLREAGVTLDSARVLPFQAERWDRALAELGTIDVRVASSLVDRLVDEQRLTAGQAARLLVDDALRWERHDPAQALDRFHRAERVAGDSIEGDLARARATIHQFRRVRSVDSIAAYRAAFERALIRGGEAAGLVGPFVDIVAGLDDALTAGSADPLTLFRRAEEVRDTLRASSLAVQVFLRVAERDPSGVLAPKALLAVAALEPSASDSLRRVLRTRFPDSPYTRAAHGLPSPRFEFVEDSLRRLLLDASVPRRSVSRGDLDGDLLRPDTSGYDARGPA